MSTYWQFLMILVFTLGLFQKSLTYRPSENDFQRSVDNFMDAFDQYSTDIGTDESSSESEVAVEESTLGEELVKENEEQPVPSQEELIVPMRVLKPGSELRHELTEEVLALAQRAVAAISPSLRLVNVTEAFSMVTDRVQRSLSLVVAEQECEGESCSVACRVDLVSKGGVDQVTWHNCLDSATANEVFREKRGAVGGFKEVDEAEAKELAEIAVQTLDSIDADDDKRIVTKVLRAQKQLVNGIMYHLTLEVALTDGKESDDGISGKITDYNICKILMQRLFSGDAPRNAQVIKSECTPISQAKELGDKKKRVRREITMDGSENNLIGEEVLPLLKDKLSRRKMGGQVTQDTNSAKIKEISEFVLSELDKSSDSLNKQQIVRIVDARTQVVAGVKYFLKLEFIETDCRKDSDQDKCNPTTAKPVQSCEVVVWEKPWLKFKAVTRVGCSPLQTRTKRALGGKKPADVNSERVKEMAEFAVSQLTASSDSPNSRKLLVIKEAQTQVVSGTNYFLKLQLVETSCRKDSTDSDCAALTDKPVQECDVVIWDQPWTKHREMTKSDCYDVKSVSKRSVLGGKSPADVNSERVKEMAEFAVSQLTASSDSPNSHKLLVIKEAQTQVVSGTNYFLKLQLVETSCKKDSTKSDCAALTDKAVQECDVVIWDQPWTKHREMTKSDCYNVKSVTNSNIQPGGLAAADVNDKYVQEVARFAVSQLDASSNSLNSQQLVIVKEAQTQVVAGTNYYLKLQLVETNCRKGSEVEGHCAPIPDKAVQECDVVVYDRAWDKHREMTSANCSTLKKPSKQETLIGGHTAQDKDSEDVQTMAQFAVDDLNKKSNALFKKTLVEVVSAHTQVVAGVSYHLRLRIAESDCAQNSENTGKCNPKDNVEHQLCNFTVVDQSWKKLREVIKSECGPFSDAAKSLTKREAPALVGGRFDQDENSQEIKDIAQFAVEELNKQSNSVYKQTLVEVLSAKTQVVTGVNYHLTLTTAESNCKNSDALKSVSCAPKDAAATQECEVTVWSRPWLSSRQVTKSSCKPSQSKTVIGKPKAVDLSSPEVQEAVKFILKNIDGSSNSMYKRALVKVVDARVQTVSGKKYFLTLEVGDSECLKEHKRENCALRAENTLSQRCNAVVWDRPWLHKMEVLEVNCRGRDKRSVRQGPSESDIQLSLFEEFKAKYNRKYASEAEHNKRFRIFRANLKKMKTFQENEQGTAVYGPNMFADLSETEFKKKYLGLKPGSAPKPSKHHMVPAKIPNNDLPTDFDWRDHNAVTPVKNQGSCGSCWAFSVTGNIEGQWALKHGNLLSFSEQELVDCDKADSGCNGGYMTQAYESIEKIGGLETEDDYPYDAQDEKCKFNSSEVQATVSSSVNITTNETEIAQWLYANGPISIGINANAMQFYMGGVSHLLKFLCSKSQLDHGVLLVGFGVHRTTFRHKLLPYWLVKNSWGPHWGDKGYYRVYRGDSTCGVNQMCSSAIVN